MRAALPATFVRLTKGFEGATTWLYLAALGIRTTAYGNALFSAPASAALPWFRLADGAPASTDEIVAEYFAVLALKGQRNSRGVLWTDCGGGVFANLTRLRLHDDGVTTLVTATFEKNHADLLVLYPDLDEWPLCAALAVHSLAWACGDAYHFPKMDAALARGDFAMAALEIEMTPEHNPGNHLEARNAANKMLMENAARVRDYHLDPDLVDWTDPICVTDLPTVPELPNPPSDPPVLEADGGASREQATFDAVDELATTRDDE